LSFWFIFEPSYYPFFFFYKQYINLHAWVVSGGGPQPPEGNPAKKTSLGTTNRQNHVPEIRAYIKQQQKKQAIRDELNQKQGEV
jgi:hypothetical protein